MRIRASISLILGMLLVSNAIADSPPGDTNASVATSNIAHCQGNFSFVAPTGWTVKTSPSGASACDMKGEHDCAALIGISNIYHSGTLEKYAHFRFDLEKTTHPQSTVELVELKPFTTDSGWAGFKGISTVTTNNKSNVTIFYFFEGHEDNKVEVQMSCHGDAADYYTPLFDAAIKTLAQE